MKRIAIAAMLFATPVSAKQAVLSCFTQTTREHVVIMGNGQDVRLQWNGGAFEYGTAEFTEDRWLFVQQFSGRGTFRLVYDSQTGTAYGGTVFYDGRENKTPFYCVWQ